MRVRFVSAVLGSFRGPPAATSLLKKVRLYNCAKKAGDGGGRGSGNNPISLLRLVMAPQAKIIGTDAAQREGGGEKTLTYVHAIM